MTLDELNSAIRDPYPMTEKQFKFVESFVIHKNGMRAIREAGYSHSTPGSQSSAAYRLLRLKKIQKAIEMLNSG